MFYPLLRLLWRLFMLLDFVLFTAVMYLLAWLPSFITRHFYFLLFQSWCRAFVNGLGVDLKLMQQNARPLPKRYLMIANHPSAFEDIGMAALFPVYSLAKVEVRKWWIVGRISRAAGTLYVHRESRESRNEAARQIEQALAAGKNIALYPEGGCKGRRIYQDFRYGAFDISLRTGTPIVPVFIHYEAQEDFEWQEPHTLLHKLWHFLTTKNNRANYYVFDALEPAEFDDKEQYMQYVHDLYLKWQAKYLE